MAGPMNEYENGIKRRKKINIVAGYNVQSLDRNLKLDLGYENDDFPSK